MISTVCGLVREHVFGYPLIGGADAAAGCINAGDRLHEEEAAELGAELLLPKAAAIRAAWASRTDAQVAEQYDVSVQLASWRMNATGARLIVTRALAKRGGRPAT
jgi:hypothetical protein